MIKWKPFYSIPEIKNIVNTLEKEKRKIARPILLQDLKEEINYKLIYAIKNNETINIKYFKNGEIKYEIGKIEKIDKNNKFLIINKKRILFKNLINIK